MASGTLLAVFVPQSNEPPVSIAATLDLRNNHPVLDFDDTADEEAVFSGIMPPSAIYTGGGITVRVYFSATLATSGNVVWQVAFESLDTQDMDSDSFAAFQSSGAVATSGTSGVLTSASIALTDGAQIDSVAAGSRYRLKIRRDADNTSATDSMTGDAELRFVGVYET